MLTFSHYGRTRFWAVYEGETLLCVVVYLKGALAVIERISGVRPEPPPRRYTRFGRPPEQCPSSTDGELSV